MESYYIIDSKINNIKKHYYVNITETDDEDNILVGGLKMKCVNIIIDKIKNIGLLELLQHNFKCSLFTNLQKGEEVKNLIENSLHFVISKYPELKYIEFIDNSFIICKNKNRVSLPDITFVKYNKTWYEKNFGAIPSKNLKDNIKILKKQILKNLNKKLKLNLEDFMNEYYSNKFFKNKNFMDLIKNIYIKNMLLKDFLDKIMEYDYIFYEKIFSDLIGNLLQGTKWIIKIDTIQKYDITSDITSDITNTKKNKK
jgi:hypothetical protein